MAAEKMMPEACAEIRRICSYNEKLKEENKKLKEENKKLKEEKIIAVAACDANIEIIDKWEADDESLTKVMSMVSKELGEEGLWTSVDDIYDIVKKLKEENEELKLCCDDITRCEEAFDKGLLTGELPLSCGVAPDGGDKYVRRQLEKETEELKEEIEELNSTILARDEELGDIEKNVFTGYDEDIKKLKGEIEELKEAITGVPDSGTVEFCVGVLEAERMEYKKYKAKANENYAKDWLSDRMKEMNDWVYEGYHEEVKWEIIDEKVKFAKENEKLKEKIKEFEENRESVVHYLASDYESRIARETCCGWFNITLAEIEAVERMRLSDSEEEEDSDDGVVGLSFRPDSVGPFRKDAANEGCDSHPDEQYA